MSAMAVLLVASIASPTLPAQPQNDTITAEEALEQTRALTAVAEGRCAPGDLSDEIVVCARQRTPPRLPLPAERGPRDGARRATGETQAASAAPMRSDSCGARAGDRCTGGLPVLPMIFKSIDFAGKVIGAILDPDE